MIEDDRGHIAREYVFQCLFNTVRIVGPDGVVRPLPRRRRCGDGVEEVQREEPVLLEIPRRVEIPSDAS